MKRKENGKQDVKVWKNRFGFLHGSYGSDCTARIVEPVDAPLSSLNRRKKTRWL
jgi:hypothetical protein